MTYEAIINGARGLLYFGGNNAKAMTPADLELGWNWTFWNTGIAPGRGGDRAARARFIRHCWSRQNSSASHQQRALDGIEWCAFREVNWGFVHSRVQRHSGNGQSRVHRPAGDRGHSGIDVRITAHGGGQKRKIHRLVCAL